MVKRIIAILLISIAYSCTASKPGVIVEEKKPIKYRVVVHKSNGEKIVSQTLK